MLVCLHVSLLYAVVEKEGVGLRVEPQLGAWIGGRKARKEGTGEWSVHKSGKGEDAREVKVHGGREKKGGK